MQPQLAIITVNYKNKDDFNEFLKSFALIKDNFHMYVVDNSPQPEDIDTYPWLIRLTMENNGYAAALNYGVKQALKDGFTKFVVMNSDTRVDKQFVERALQDLTDTPGCIFGPKIYYEAGFEYHKDRYSQKDLGKVLWYAGGHTDWNHAFTIHRGVDEVDKGQYDKMEKTSFITGCCMCFDKQVLDTVGYWDESYFLYYEDADFCERALRKGIILYYDPKLVLWHKVSRSTGGSGSKLHQRFQERNRVKFGLKFAPWRTKFHLMKNYLLRRSI